MEKKKSLSRSFLLNMFFITIVSIGLLGCLWTWNHYTTFNRESKEIREMMLNSYQEMLKTQVQRSVDYIEYKKSLTEQKLRTLIQERVNEGYRISTHIFEKYKDHKSPEEIQMLIIESLRTVRFNQGRGYFFITGLDGIEKLFADRPEMEGKSMLEVQGGHGEYVVRDMIKLVKQQGEGFYRYYWSRPGMAEGYFPKIAFVKLFSPYNWFIGTGEYLEDVQNNIQAEVLDYLATIRFGKDGYVFVTQWDGLDLVGPARGKNMLRVTDVNGVKIVQEMIKLAKSGGGFLAYVMPKFKGMKPDPKLSYVQGIKEWEWYVGAGVYIDDIEKAIEKNRAEMIREIVNSLIKIVAVLLGIMGFVYFYARRTSNNARASFNLFTAFFEKGARESAVIDPDAMKYEEFESLAHSANQMIEARKLAQAALSESEEKYRLIVENINDLVIKLDRQKKLIFASPTYCALFGMTEEEILKKDFLTLILDEDHELVQKSLNILDEPPFTSYHEERTLTKSGIRWFAWSSRAIMGDDDRPAEYVCVGRDITEKKQAEEALSENREWLQSILDSIQAGVIVIDPETHVVIELNRAATEMIGAKKEDIVNKICHNHICPNDFGTCPVTDQGLSEDQSDRELLKADGTSIPILKTVSCATISGKEYLIESFLDLSEKKELESMLLQSQKMESIGTLAGGIAHDFNNLLMGIQGRTSMMLNDLEPKTHPHLEHLMSIEEYIRSATNLTKQLLGLARRGKYEVKPTDLNELVKKSSKLFGRTKKELIIHRKCQEDIWAVEVDQSQIEQVLLNLYVNAWQSMPNGGELYLQTENIILDEDHVRPHYISPGKYVKISVTDTGVGMDDAILDRIFDPFFTTKEMGRGTGLGLASAYGIIKNHNGMINVSSREGKGTTFNIYLPASSKEIIRQTELEKDTIKGDKVILLVDDERIILDVGKPIIERLGYKVFIASNGKEALEIFKKRKKEIDLVILDMIMPDMNGGEIFDQLKMIDKDVKVLLSSGYSIDGQASEIIERGCRGFIQKPFSMTEISKKIYKILEQ